MTDEAPILAVVGLAREARIASGPEITTIGAGGSPARLRRLLAEREPACRTVVSFGIAGGLDPGLTAGTLVVASGVVGSERRWATDPAIAAQWTDRITEAGLLAVTADLAGVDEPVLNPAAKAALRSATGTVAVDMESHVAAAFAASRGVPFAAIRVVCDPAGRALPTLATQALRPDGGIDLAAILRNLLRHPAELAALPALARDAATAFKVLGRARAALGPGFGLGGLGIGQPLGHVL